MNPRADSVPYPDHFLRQVAADARTALARAGYHAERSPVRRLRCIEWFDETEHEYGRQMWFFESRAVDNGGRRLATFGAIEYSVQYGLTEVVEDGVFDSADQRERFHQVFLTASTPPTTPGWKKRWFFAFLSLVAISLAVGWLVRHIVLLDPSILSTG